PFPAPVVPPWGSLFPSREVRPTSATPMTSPSQPPCARERGSGSPARPDRASTRPDGASSSARQQSENGSQSPVVRRPLILAAGCGALILLLLLSVGGVFAVRAIIGPDDQE